MAKPRVSLTRSQIEEGLGAELFSLCQGMTADGKLARGEIVALGLWLRDNREAPLPGIAFLSETLERIIADGRITRDEQRELMEAVEKVLPPDERREAKAARKLVEAARRAQERAAADAARDEARQREQRRWPEDEFDFYVAGVGFEGRHHLVGRHLNVGDRVRLAPEPDNPKDEFAVAVTLADGRQIGYVPRADSADVLGCLEDGGYYVAVVKKILTGREYPVPVIDLKFYGLGQIADIADLDPQRSMAGQPIIVPRPPKPWWKPW